MAAPSLTDGQLGDRRPAVRADRRLGTTVGKHLPRRRGDRDLRLHAGDPDGGHADDVLDGARRGAAVRRALRRSTGAPARRSCRRSSSACSSAALLVVNVGKPALFLALTSVCIVAALHRLPDGDRPARSSAGCAGGLGGEEPGTRFSLGRSGLAINVGRRGLRRRDDDQPGLAARRASTTRPGALVPAVVLASAARRHALVGAAAFLYLRRATAAPRCPATPPSRRRAPRAARIERGRSA